MTDRSCQKESPLQQPPPNPRISGKHQGDRYRRNVERVATVITTGIRNSMTRAVRLFSLAQAIDVALMNNPSTRAAWLETRAAESALGSRRSTCFPEVDLDASLSRSRSTQAAAWTTWGPSISLTYLLFDFGGRAAQVEEARQTLIATAYSQNQTIQNVVLRTRQACYSYLAAKALVAAQTSAVRERQTAVDAADARHGAGVATIADVLQARTARSQAQLAYESFEGNLCGAEGTLSNAMGFPPTARFTVGDLPADLPVDTVAPDVEQQSPNSLTTPACSANGRTESEDQVKTKIR